MSTDNASATSSGRRPDWAALLRATASHFRSLAALIALACGAILAFLIRTGWFAEDDFSNLATAKQMGLTVEFLFRPIFETRLSPGHRLVDWLVLQWPGQEWTVVVIISGACLAGATFFAALLVREVTGSSLVGLGAAALFGTWVGWVRIGLWWPTSAHTLPAVLLMLACLWLILRWSRTHGAGLLVAIVALAAAAMMFSSRSSLIPAIAAVMLVLGGPGARSISLREALGKLKANWQPIAATLVAAAVFVYFESRTPGFRDRIPSPGLSVWLTYLRIWMVDAQSSFALNQMATPAQGLFTRTIPGLLVIAGLAAATIRGSRSACIWVGAIVLVLACGVQVGWARLGQLGTGMGFDPRYHEGDIVVALALIPCAWAAAGRPSPRTGRQSRALAAVLLMIGLGWIALLGLGAHRIRSEPLPSLSNPGAVPRATFATLRQTLPTAVRGTRSPTLVNSTFPRGLTRMRGTDIRDALEVFLPDYRFSRLERTGEPILVDDTGNALRLNPTQSAPVPDGKRICVETAPGSQWLAGGSANLELPLPPPRAGATRMLEFRLRNTRGQGNIAITFQPSDNNNYPEVLIPLTSEREGLRMAVPPTSTGAQVALWGGIATCLTGTRVTYSVG